MSSDVFAMATSFRFGLSSMSNIGGQLFGSIETAASRVLSNFIILCMDKTITLFDTSTIMRTVGRVVIKFCGCGGRMVTGVAPKYRHP